jgi:NADPH:quinone reductase-like Zn-dependent oxidoreductase
MPGPLVGSSRCTPTMTETDGPERTTMKAAGYTEYGQPDVIELREVARPIPKDNEVLVRVCAASVNSWDWDLLRGTPFLNRLNGLFTPKHTILGCDIAGRVETLGKKAKRFRPGDEVFGDLSGGEWGGFAEYVCARENALAPKPAELTFEDAAAVPQAGLLALQGLRDKGKIHKGQAVLVNGAGGGAGTFAVQIAKAYGAEVTGVDSAEKLVMLRSIGADHVIDYAREDFTKKGQHYDLILDVVTHRSFFDYRRVLNPDGRYVMLGWGSWPRVFQAMLLGPLISAAGSRKMGILVLTPNKGLDTMTDLIEAGKVKPVIDRCYPLSEVAEAIRHFGEGHARGKVVITVDHKDKTNDVGGNS